MVVLINLFGLTFHGTIFFHNFKLNFHFIVAFV